MNRHNISFIYQGIVIANIPNNGHVPRVGETVAFTEGEHQYKQFLVSQVSTAYSPTRDSSTVGVGLSLLKA
jgi:hypothetical protein